MNSWVYELMILRLVTIVYVYEFITQYYEFICCTLDMNSHTC
jgi:hypothetical protein